MKLINPEGCWRCNVMGHAMFCGCPCHNGGPTIKEQLEARGFELGAQWYSRDSGLTWERLPPPGYLPSQGETLTVIGVDYSSGAVTVRIGGVP